MVRPVIGLPISELQPLPVLFRLRDSVQKSYESTCLRELLVASQLFLCDHRLLAMLDEQPCFAISTNRKKAIARLAEWCLGDEAKQGHNPKRTIVRSHETIGGYFRAKDRNRILARFPDRDSRLLFRSGLNIVWKRSR